ncbi:two component transcriptional regulator, LuxR family [Pirellula staleyi DSM 6068]|uniref:Two component transcriptional regulator, LuxR family n=1 Tax=Pirellula staleyi (strain ATCC 27377 / DSM 6068 / ICPB 4128) TaxID=530564 RepID=D2R9J0_PIRSD|nr:response regulator [Pirellula staleyi]ADB17740.1 two component transcriptional regulator, LuxR family [Pirellula staleyi DSM 6068]
MNSREELQVDVHVIDDDKDVRNSVDWTLRSVGYNVDVHSDPEEFLKTFQPKCPSCLVVDLLLPGMTGLKLCQELLGKKANCTFVMLTGHGDVPSAVEAMQMGAVDFLEKPCTRQKLINAVQRAIEQLRIKHQEAIENEEIRARLENLSPREREIFEWMVEGFVTKEIASRLGISTKTVDVHRSKISQKLRIDSPAQLGHVFAVHLRGRAGRKSDKSKS